MLERFRRKGAPARTPSGEEARGPADDRPILAVDVDGVISLFGFDSQAADRPGIAGVAENAPGEYHLIDGTLHCISLPVGDRLRRVAEAYQLVWATGWEDRANDHLTLILGLPELDYLRFGRSARFGTAHWKLGPLEEYAGSRPLAWIDDSFDHSCYEWAEQRTAPTLLLPTDPAIGMEEGHVESLLAWARDGFQPR